MAAFPHPSLSALQAEALTILAEEASEVAIECSKILRSGLEYCRNGKGAPNKDRLTTEVIDFLVLLEICRRLDLVVPHDEAVVETMVQAKLERLANWSNLGEITV